MTADRPALRPAVFLDRDGVLNDPVVRDGKPYPPRSVSDVRVSTGAVEGCERLKAEGFVLAVVTNQPDVARGTTQYSTVNEINAYLQSRLPLDSVWVCPHDDPDRCSCRKPAPGLLYMAAEHHHIDLPASFLVGDRWRDIEAGQAAGCRTILISHRGYDEPLTVPPDHTAADLAHAAAWILEQHHAVTPEPQPPGVHVDYRQ
jgi:D-glycero-D-manno-heptose 1,7-bisphosphate phosphatase